MKYFDSEKFTVFKYSILVTSFVISLRILGSSDGFENIEIFLYYIELSFFVFWGAIAGLNYKKSIQCVFIKKTFNILLFVIMWISLFVALISVDADILDKFGLLLGSLRSLMVLTIIIPMLVSPFIVGYIIAWIVHFFIDYSFN